MKIYGFFNSKSENGDAVGIAVDENGVVLASHLSSCESWSIHDLGMGMGSEWKHDEYNKAHPEGWTCEFVKISDDRDNHPGLQAALAAHHRRESALELAP